MEAIKRVQSMDDEEDPAPTSSKNVAEKATLPVVSTNSHANYSAEESKKIDDLSISGTLWRLTKQGEIEVQKRGSGKTASIYRRVPNNQTQ